MKTNRIIHAGFWFGKSDVNEAIKLAQNGIGGFCIYFGTLQEVKKLTDTLQANAPHKLLFSADYEYGLGRWLPDAPLLPSNISIGATDNKDFAYQKGFITACQAKAIGINWVLAPDIDMACTPQNPIVNTRSFGANAQRVTNMARAFMMGLADGGCLNSLKHFPGHGSTLLDSHMQLPTVNKTLQQLADYELVPYKELLTKADSIMVAHLMIAALDDKKPTSFSPKVITDLLRKHLHYKGLIVTDALVMKATGGQNPLDAFKAGADILLCPDNPLALLEQLQAAVNADKSLVYRAVDALSAQEMMLTKINTTSALPCNNPFATESLSAAVAASAVVAVGQQVVLNPKETVHYLEPDIYPQISFKANTFIDTLKAAGIKLKPYVPGDKPQKLVITTMANYAAFSGHINFTEQQKTLLQTALDSANQAVLISFGSPFVNLGIDNLRLFLMAGTQTPPFQQISAQILLGQAQAKGKMP